MRTIQVFRYFVRSRPCTKRVVTAKPRSPDVTPAQHHRNVGFGQSQKFLPFAARTATSGGGDGTALCDSNEESASRIPKLCDWLRKIRAHADSGPCNSGSP